MIKNILNLGDAALYCDFGKEVNKETNTQVIRYFKSIQKENISSINNLSPSYNKLIISFDLKKTNFKDLKKIIENLNITNEDNLKNPADFQIINAYGEETPARLQIVLCILFKKNFIVLTIRIR